MRVGPTFTALARQCGRERTWPAGRPSSAERGSQVGSIAWVCRPTCAAETDATGLTIRVATACLPILTQALALTLAPVAEIRVPALLAFARRFAGAESAPRVNCSAVIRCARLGLTNVPGRAETPAIVGSTDVSCGAIHIRLAARRRPASITARCTWIPTTVQLRPIHTIWLNASACHAEAAIYAVSVPRAAICAWLTRTRTATPVALVAPLARTVRRSRRAARARDAVQSARAIRVGEAL
jgi:hypothetical protein